MKHCRCGTAIAHCEDSYEKCGDEISKLYKKQATRLQQAGTFGYEPANQLERAAHKRAVRNKNWSNGRM